MMRLCPYGKRVFYRGIVTAAFGLKTTMSRAEFVAMLAKFIYEEGRELENTYVDVDETDWFYPSIEKWRQTGFYPVMTAGFIRTIPLPGRKR